MSNNRQRIIFRVTVLCAAALTLMTADALAQPGAPEPPGPDRMRQHFFPPELVMHHQQKIKLTKTQRQAFMKEMKSFQSTALDIQFKMANAGSQLEKTVGGARVSESKALAQADKVLALERKMKLLHLTLLIRIKNLLSKAQQAQLKKLQGS